MIRVNEAVKSEPRVPDMPTDDIADGAFRDWALVIDAMPVLQSMKKTAALRTLADLKETFIRRIENMLTGFNKGRIIFDRYLEQFLKKLDVSNEGSDFH